MKSKLICFLILLTGSMLPVNATIVQKLILKNGSELEGYISMQRPGENFVFTTERAMILMPSQQVKSQVDHDINILDLPQSWKDWARENDAFEGLGDNRILLLSDIVTETGTISKVRILERGAKIRYIEMTPNTYSLNWDTIAVVQVEKRPKIALSGINRVYQLDSGMEYEGQYVEEVPGRTLSLFRDNGVIEVFETDKVVKYSMRKINPNQTLWEQSELSDIIQLKNGSQVKGIIIEQNYTDKKDSDNYLLIQLENGITQSVKLNDIVEYRKEVNPLYNPLYDILLREGELVINRYLTDKIHVREIEGGVLLDPGMCDTVIESEHPVTKVIVEAHFANEMESQQLRVLKVNEYTDKKKNKAYGFTFEDIVKSSIPPLSIQTSVNNTTKMEYSMNDTGLYVIYNPQLKTAIPFEIK